MFPNPKRSIPPAVAGGARYRQFLHSIGELARLLAQSGGRSHTQAAAGSASRTFNTIRSSVPWRTSDFCVSVFFPLDMPKKIRFSHWNVHRGMTKNEVGGGASANAALPSKNRDRFIHCENVRMREELSKGLMKARVAAAGGFRRMGVLSSFSSSVWNVARRCYYPLHLKRTLTPLLASPFTCSTTVCSPRPRKLAGKNTFT